MSLWEPGCTMLRRTGVGCASVPWTIVDGDLVGLGGNEVLGLRLAVSLERVFSY